MITWAQVFIKFKRWLTDCQNVQVNEWHFKKAFLGLEQSHLRPNRVVTNRNNKLSFFPVVTFVLGFGWPHSLHHDWLKPGLATEGSCLGLRLRGTFRSDYYLMEESPSVHYLLWHSSPGLLCPVPVLFFVWLVPGTLHQAVVSQSLLLSCDP